MTRILNELNSLQEISDTMTTIALLGLNTGLSVYVVESALKEKNRHLSLNVNERIWFSNSKNYNSESTSESMQDFIVSDTSKDGDFDSEDKPGTLV